MPNRPALATAAALVAVGLSACSSEPQPQHPNGASVTINGNTVLNKQPVKCVQQQWYWLINIGDQNVSGVKATVNGNGKTLFPNSVQIRNLGGFTGMYAAENGGNADMTFSQATFTITGTAEGFNTAKPDERAKATFKIVATC
jgi:ipoprotein LpqH